MENNKNIEKVGNSGLVCDNSNCDWEDTTIKDEDIHKYINHSCPKCGENVLTQEDYDMHVALFNAVDFVNTLNPEQIKTLSKLLADNSNMVDPTSLGINLDINKHIDTDTLKSDDLLSVQVKVHKGINIENVKKIE